MQRRLKEQTYRNLAALRRAGAKSRVWDVAACTAGQERADPEGPRLFQSAMLNRAIVLKHRLRPHEHELFDAPPDVATKVIVPFSVSDLRLGGRSLFVGERAWPALIGEICAEAETSDDDARLLEAVAELPSLDPFLLAQHLRRRGFAPPPAYLGFAQAEQIGLRDYCAEQLGDFVRLATGVDCDEDRIARAVARLLADEDDKALEALRASLRLDARIYEDGMFAWRVFLYFKWALRTYRPQVNAMLRQVSGGGVPRGAGASRSASEARARLLLEVADHLNAAADTLQLHDDAVEAMVRWRRPDAFRDFLRRAPALCCRLAETMATLDELANCWSRREDDGQTWIGSSDDIDHVVAEMQDRLAATHWPPRAAVVA